MNYTDGTSANPTTPHIVSIFGETGDTGRGIASITNYYAVNNSDEAPADGAFSTTIASPTASNRYL